MKRFSDTVSKKGRAVLPDTSPSLSKTISFIKGLLAHHVATALPSIRAIARHSNVSLVTASRAIAVLKDAGVVESVWGKGIYPFGNVPQPVLETIQGSAKREHKFQTVINALKNDIQNERFESNKSLPLKSELTQLYNASYPTICKALDVLVRDKILNRSASRYYVHTNRSARRQRAVVIAFGLGQNAVKIETERERNFYRLLTSAASQNAVDLEIICYNDYGETPQFYVPQGGSLPAYLRTVDACGIILSTYHMKNSAQCLRRLAGIQKPLSIWAEDQHALELVKDYGTAAKQVTFFDTSYSPLPGKEVGSFLFDKGHRHIAFISPFHGSVWSQNRFLGLQQSFAGLQNHCAVSSFVLDGFDSDYSFMEKILEKSSFDKTAVFGKLTKAIDPCFVSRIASVEHEYNALLRDDLIFRYCKPLVDRAASMPQLTAWVCVNDLVACLITDYWNCRDVPISKRPALVGFDNSFGSIERGISSYEFNTRGEVQSMIGHLLYPNRTLLSTKKGSLRLSGTVIERGSTVV